MKEKDLNFVFFGSGELAYIVLKELVEGGFRPTLVVTLPDRVMGRGKRIRSLPVKTLAIENGIPVFTPEKLREKESVETIKSYMPDFVFLCDYGRILPAAILKIPRIAPLNLHPSRLPKYRGPAPIERAIMEGEREIGITIIIMAPKVDEGDLVMQGSVEYEPPQTKGDILPMIAEIGAKMLIESALGLKRGEIRTQPQPSVGASYAPKIGKEETVLDLNNTADKETRRVLALSPKPGVKVLINNRVHKILRAKPTFDIVLKPWSILIKGKNLYLGAREGAVQVLEIQPEGKKPMKIADYLNGYRPETVTPFEVGD